jgi:hypothetical protein
MAVWMKIWHALAILRKFDTAVCDRNQGWVTTVDNILTVLLYRDYFYYSKDFIGELQFSVSLEIGSRQSSIRELDQRAVIYRIKQSLLAGYHGLSAINKTVLSAGYDSDDEHSSNSSLMSVDTLVLRHKENVTQIGNCCYCCVSRDSQLVKMTFGIVADLTPTKAPQNRYYPYQFMYIAKQLFTKIHTRSFVNIFNTYSRKMKFNFRMREINADELKAVQYAKRD